jgi:hypothetical protein
MSNMRANIRNHVKVVGLSISINTIYPIQAFARGKDGAVYVELYDMTNADHDCAELIGSTGMFGDTYAGTGYCPASIREKVATLVEQSKYYAGGRL